MNIDEQVELLMLGTEYGDEDLKKAMTTALQKAEEGWHIYFIAYLIKAAGVPELNIVFYPLDEKGAVKHWSVELGSPSILLRSGWKFTDVKPGDKITAILNPLRDGRPGGMLYRLTLPDGTMRGNGTAPPADPPATRSAP